MDTNALAQTGAQVIVTAMATEAWAQLRTRLGRLFGRGEQAREDASLAELDDTLRAVTAAGDEQAEAEALGELRGQLKTRLREDPGLAAQFQALVEEVAAQLSMQRQTTTVRQRAEADHGGIVMQAGRDMTTGAVGQHRSKSP